MRRAGPLLVLAAGLVLLTGSGLAQPRELLPAARLAGASARAAGRLATADGRIEKQQWSDAIAELQTLLDESADELVPVKADKPDHCVAVRRLYQQRLAALPPAGLKLYRSRFDDQAKKLLDQAVPARDVGLLRRIVDDAFASRPAERAIDLLGDLALERGDFIEAQRWWRMLALPASEVKAKLDDLALTFPDPQADTALIRAKLLLAKLLSGNRVAVQAELPAYRAAHPKAAGPLAGRDGNYADTLAALLARPGPPRSAGLTDWPTFAGDPERNGIAAACPRVRWLDEPWRARLDGEPVQGVLEPAGKIENPTTAARALTVHPVIAGKHVLTADPRTVTVFDLLTGKRQGRFDLLDDPKLAHLKLDAARQGERCTLTVADDRVYARLGSTVMGAAREAKEADSVGDSFLVCLKLPPVEGKLAVQWQVAARQPDRDAIFEGAPLVDAGRVWIARLRCQRAWAATEIECYTAQSGTLRWRQSVCESQENTEETRQRQHLLTLAGPNVVYCSHAGAVVALDAVTGKRAWAVRYPRRGYRIANGLPTPRELTPCLYAGGRIYVAPADAEALLCLDAATGRTLWQSRPLEVGHLLGVVHGKVIFTTAGTPRGIRALDANTGADLRQWLHPSGGHDELPSFGRGILAGDKVLWPTVHGLRVLDQDTGQVSADDFVPLNRVRPGNIAVGHGCVVIATERELHGYVAPRHFLDQRRKDAAAQPKSAAAQLRLAEASADAGVLGEARQHAQAAGGPGAIALEHALLLEEAAGRGPDAGKLLAAAAVDRFTPAQQVTALRQLTAGPDPDALDAWQVLLGRQALRARLALAESPARVAEWQQTHGPALAARQEKPAKEAVARRNGTVDEEFARELARQYPFAAATTATVEQVAQRFERDGSHGRAADLYRLLLRLAWDPRQHSAALAALTRCGERPAVGQPAGLPELAVPLSRRWEVPLVPGRDQVIAAQPGDTRRWFCVHDDQTLLCRDASDGKVRWQCRWPFAVRWVGRHSDLVLAAGPGGVGGCRVDDGAISWVLEPGAECAAFHLAAGRLFLLLSQTQFVAIDPETGLPLWHQAAPGAELRLPPPGGRFLPGYHADGERILARTGLGEPLLFTAATGKVLHTGTPIELPWNGANLVSVGERRVCIATDPRHLSVLDLESGRPDWQHTLAHPTTLAGELPQLLGDANTLLVMVARNYGHELLRLDIGTGKPRWAQPVLFRGAGPQVAAGALDRTAAYFAVGDTLEAYALSDGRRLWQMPLPAGVARWQVVPTRHALLVIPRQAVLSADTRFLWRHWLPIAPTAFFPAPGRSPGNLWAAATTAVAMAQSPSHASIVVCDPKNGQRLQTLDCAGQGSTLIVSQCGPRLVVALGTAAWGFQ